jgi:hypothetical protein
MSPDSQAMLSTAARHSVPVPITTSTLGIETLARASL